MNGVKPPEGGWQDGDQVALIHGPHLRVLSRIGREWFWRDDTTLVVCYDYAVDHRVASGDIVYVHAPRDPEPVMAPLPTEPCAIRATVVGVEGVALVGPVGGEWRSAVEINGYYHHEPEHITAWSPLLTAEEWQARQESEQPDLEGGVVAKFHQWREEARNHPSGKPCDGVHDATPDRRIVALVDHIDQHLAAEYEPTTDEDRSAGRWCEVCGQHGSHHTDRHDEYTTTDEEDDHA